MIFRLFHRKHSQQLKQKVTENPVKYPVKRWEAALAFAVSIAFCHALAMYAGWWGVIFPGLASDGTEPQPESIAAASVEALSDPDQKSDGARKGSGIALRFQILEWLEEFLARDSQIPDGQHS